MTPGYTVFLLTVLSTGFVVVLALLRLATKRRTHLDIAAERAERVVADFVRQVNLLRQEREVLDLHLNEYFQTFTEAGWPNLVQLLLRLGRAEEELTMMLDQDRYDDALQLALFLLDGTPQAEVELARRKFSANANLIGWKDRADEIILRIIQQLEVAAAQTEDIGVSRRRKRQSTFLAIHEIRDLYLRERGE